MNPQLPVLALIAAAISLVPVRLLAQGAVPGAKPSAKLVSVAKPAKAAVPRLPDGHPDLGGFWSNNTAIPLPAGSF
jgi:hypothetical protein